MIGISNMEFKVPAWLQVLDIQPIGQVVAAGVAYASLVFAAGFLLGTIRVLYLTPRLGNRYSELLEMPFMHLVIVKAAHFTVHSTFGLGDGRDVRLLTGFVGVSLLLGLEVLFAVVLQGKSGRRFWSERDPVSGMAYLGMLMVFALMPFIHIIR